MVPHERRHQVVVVGAGFGGLAVARGLTDSPVDVTVIDARNHHTFQPLLYQVATAGLDVDDVCHSVRGIFQRQRNVRVMLARMTGIDQNRRCIVTADGATVPYDSLVLACGAVTADFGVPGVQDHAFGLKNAADALDLRDHVLRQFEDVDARPDGSPGRLTFVVVGAGPTGVELAGGLAELVHRVLRRDFPGLDVDRVRIVLLEASDAVLGTFAPRLGRRARRALERLGVEVKTGTTVAEVTAESAVLGDGSSIDTQTVVWAAGVRANPIGAALGLETDRGGRVVVDEMLRVAGSSGVYAIGDLAGSSGEAGRPLPQVAPVAIQGGEHVAATIAALVGVGEDPGPFSYRDKGSMATIGRHAAVAELPGGRAVSGPVGWVAWLALHLVMLIGFRNRANVVVNWVWNYLTYDRGSRVIIDRSDGGTELETAVDAPDLLQTAADVDPEAPRRPSRAPRS